MDGTLTLIFTKLETSWNITTKTSALLQLRKKWILTKFEGCGSKKKPATPIWSFRCFWWEIQIQCTKSLQIWYKVGTYWGEQLVKIWCWYLKSLLRNSNFKIFCLPSVPHLEKNSFWKLFFFQVGDTWKTKNLKFWISQKWFEISTPNFHQL